MAIESIRLQIRLGLMSLTAAIGGLLFGYDTGVISSAILFIRTSYGLSSSQESIIVSIVAIGAVIGAMIAGPLSDLFGRKKIVLFSSLIFIISAFGLSIAPDVSSIIIGRVLVGVAIGSASATAPLYIAELAPRSIRGALVSLNQLAITVGILVSYICGYFFASETGWRVLFAIAAIPAAIQFFIMSFFPESPRWLTLQGKSADALSILLRYRADRADAEMELSHIQKNAEGQKGSWKELYKKPLSHALLAGAGITIIQQITGINTIIYFGPTIFQFAGFTEEKAAIFASVFVGIVNVIMTFVAIRLLDRVGRKPLLYSGVTGMVLSLIMLAFAFNSAGSSHLIGWITIVSMISYIGFFAYSLGPIAWLLNSELYPLKFRGVGMGISTCSNWISNFLVTYTFLGLIEYFGRSSPFLLYSLIGILSLWFIAKKIPETKGKSLEEIEEFWK